MTKFKQTSGYIKEENLNILLDRLALYAGEELDEGLRVYFISEIKKSNTDQTPPQYAEHTFEGHTPIKARIGEEFGCCLYSVILEVPEAIYTEMDFFLEILFDYKLT
ncbi:hypothetical protein [Hirschia maritima]|uniref:hypothetical protein n=1 Tax=Hirschia maritima TaxID=1121961 RepID=UPI00037BD356|nr:hypothetical protein [Hirschia maritima]